MIFCHISHTYFSILYGIMNVFSQPTYEKRCDSYDSHVRAHSDKSSKSHWAFGGLNRADHSVIESSFQEARDRCARAFSPARAQARTDQSMINGVIV